MADTITILDGLQFEQDATNSDVWTMDGAGAAYETVKTFTVVVPDSCSGARVIFNGDYDPDGADHYVRCKVTKVTSMASGVPTKTENTQALEWTKVSPDGSPRMVETGAIDLSASIRSTLHIDIAAAKAEATTGLEAIVQVRSEASLDEWTTLTRFIGPIGTPVKSDFAGTEAVGQTELSVTNPATGNLDHVGKFIFIENTGDVTKCEIAFLVSQSGD